ncbi:hypothetical protein [Luteimonas sp. TWI1416]
MRTAYLPLRTARCASQADVPEETEPLDEIQIYALDDLRIPREEVVGGG